MSRQVRHCRTRNLRQRKVTTALTVFWNSRFIVSVLIIFNFLAFMLVPSLVYLIYGILGNNQSDTLLSACWIAFAVSNILDSFNYIFLTGSVKTLVTKKAHTLLQRTKTTSLYKFDRRMRNPYLSDTLSELCTNTIWVTNWHMGD